MRINFYVFLLGIVFNLNLHAQNVKVSGAMFKVMREGQLQATLHIDTLNKKNLYGLGPVENLRGEIIILDGKTYVSSIQGDSSIHMQETSDVKAPFFVYSNQEKWQEITLPKNIKNLEQLESYIDKKTQKSTRPFTFKLVGKFSLVDFHIQNLPLGSVVKSPKDAHQGQVNFERKNVNGTILGYFSTQHQTIFTHHDTYMHLHYINADKTEMGHVDQLLMNGSMKIYLPKP